MLIKRAVLVATSPVTYTTLNSLHQNISRKLGPDFSSVVPTFKALWRVFNAANINKSSFIVKFGYFIFFDFFLNLIVVLSDTTCRLIHYFC